MDDVGRTAWHVAEVSASEPGAVIVADHALVLHVRDLPWKRLARNLTCGLACVAVDAEISDDEAEEERDPRCELASSYGARATKPEGRTESAEKKRSRSRWVRLCQLWVRVGVTLTRCGATRSDARLFLDGYARVSHAAPSRYSRELFGDGDDSRRNRAGGYHQTRRPFERDDDDRLRELESLRRAYRAIDADVDVDVDVDVGHPWNPRASLPNSGVSMDDRLLRRIVPLEVANDARLAENDGRRDVDAAAVASSSLTAIASEFVCAVSFTSDDALDAARLVNGDQQQFAPAIVAAALGAPRTPGGHLWRRSASAAAPPPRRARVRARAELQARRTEVPPLVHAQERRRVRLRRGAAPGRGAARRRVRGEGRAPRRIQVARAPCTSPSGTGSTPRARHGLGVRGERAGARRRAGRPVGVGNVGGSGNWRGIHHTR